MLKAAPALAFAIMLDAVSPAGAADGRPILTYHGASVRLSPDLRPSSHRRDFLTPENWEALDARGADLGGTNPVLIDLSGEEAHHALVLALGKDGHAYLLDRANLGGIDGSLINEAVSPRPIRTAPAVYSAADAAFVGFQGMGSHCSGGQGGGLTALKIRVGSRPTLATAWCALLHGAGSPIVTTTDGRADPIVWIVGAEGDNRLHAFKGETGEPLSGGGGPSYMSAPTTGSMPSPSEGCATQGVQSASCRRSDRDPRVPSRHMI